jgi:hypothetical protein
MTDNSSFMTDLKEVVDKIMTSPQSSQGKEIFKINFYKWQVYIHRR